MSDNQKPVLANLLTNVTIREGSQVPEHLAKCLVDDKIRLLEMMTKMGRHRIELTAFGKVFPDAEELASAVLNSSINIPLRALYFNVQGLEQMLRFNIFEREGIFHTAATDGYRIKNYAQTGVQGEKGVIAKLRKMTDAFKKHGLEFDTLLISTAWGDRNEAVSIDDTLEFIDTLYNASMSEGLPVQSITLADTEGLATKKQIFSLISGVKKSYPQIRVTAHLHATENNAVDCVNAAIDAKVDFWEASLGGIGGSPFANAPGGNLDIRLLAKIWLDRGYPLGLDIDAINIATKYLQTIVQTPLPKNPLTS
jgi:hydroxymethylglutaryl-CoA lyase